MVTHLYRKTSKGSVICHETKGFILFVLVQYRLHSFIEFWHLLANDYIMISDFQYIPRIIDTFVNLKWLRNVSVVVLKAGSSLSVWNGMVGEHQGRNLGSSLVTYLRIALQLSTILCDCKAEIILRPLTYLSNVDDCFQAPTLSLFL